MTFYEALEIAMNERGMNATTVATKSGVGKSYLSKMKRGDFKDPTWGKACAIIEALDMKPSEFLEIMESDNA